MKPCFLFVTVVVVVLQAYGQVPPKREFRAAWIATVANIDWPVSKADSSNPGKQQSDLTAILDSLQRIGVNAVMFHVRPSCDAFYYSAIEPTSEWLVGSQGKAISYDPLAFAISQAHARDMELHAWFNPYRAVSDTTVNSVAPTHVSKVHPEWILRYGKLKILDPGLPQVRDYVTSVIMDVVRRYDIDGVHFDDYFYPYSGTTNEDSASYNAYGSGLPIGDWRRSNVNAFVKMVGDSVRAVKPKIKYGISPFGIWKSGVPDRIVGMSSYDVIYCDAPTWLLEGWIDYLAPQLYWVIGGPQDYSLLMPWWESKSYSRHIYPGQATYRIFQNNWPVSEIANQITLNRSHGAPAGTVLGSIHFSAKYFHQSAYASRKLTDSLRATVYSNFTRDAIPRTFALLPTMAWKDNVAPNPPESLSVRAFTFSALLKWKTPKLPSDSESVSRYIVYKSTTLPIDSNNVLNVFTMTKDTGAQVDKPLSGGQIYYYAVSAIDRLNNESPLSNVVAITSTGAADLQAGHAIAQKFVLHQNFPNPFNPLTFISFTLPSEMYVSLRVYDILGREVKVLAETDFSEGTHQLQFDGSRMPSGIYFYRLVAGGYVETRKMQLIK